MRLSHCWQVWGCRWRSWRRKRAARMPRPAFDLEAREIVAIEAYIGRLEAAAGAGSIDAAGRLSDIVADRVGQARRRMAEDALNRLRRAA